MKTALHVSTLAWAGMILGSLAAMPASAQDVGAAKAWGYNWHGECNVPMPNSSFVAIAGGAYHNLGLKANGSVVAWGSNNNEDGEFVGQCNVPGPNGDFVAIGAGGFHNLGLKADGSIVAWGYNGHGQCDVPQPNSGFVAVACGAYHSLGLKADGSLVAWGWNAYDQCYIPAPNSGFVAAAGGNVHSVGLKAFQGDLNCDGVVSYADVDSFVLALAGRVSYGACYPRCHWLNADINGDGVVSYADINPFVALLSRR